MKETITQQDLSESYNELKKAAYTFFAKGDFENSLKMIDGCARLAYEFNFLENFCDDELEELLVKNFSKLKGNASSFVPKENRVLFYDYFAIDSRGLTQQYLTALIYAEFEILFIVSNDIYFKSGKEIIKQLKEYNKSKIVIYSDHLTLSERIIRLSSLIEEYKPTYSFLHLSPWDIIACATFPNYTSTKRLFINLTDHAFWLGKCTFDVCIDFRNYGYQLNRELRKIEIKKLVLLPYYPILQKAEGFLGLPQETKNKVIGLSGGSGYKFIGDNWRFYNLIKQLLFQNQNFVFLLVGCKDLIKKAFEKRIVADKLEKRFVLIDDRPDIFQLIKHVDIYFGSYPFPGGLMTQLACLAKKPVITLIDENKPFSYIDDVITFKDDRFKSYSSDEEFKTVASNAIQNISFRAELAALTNDGIITEEEFNSALIKVMNGEQPYNSEISNIKKMACLSTEMSNWYLEIENTVSKRFFNLLNPFFKVIKHFIGDSHFYEKFSPASTATIKQKIKSKLYPTLKPLYSKVKHKLNRNDLREKHQRIFCELGFKSIGENCRVPEQFMVKNPNYISIGKNFSSLYNLRIEAWDSYNGERFHPEISIGNGVCLNTDCHIGCINKVVIGNNVLIASRVYISDHSHGNISKEELKLPPIERPLLSKGPVVIEDNVWIGEGVCILPNITIGMNSIIGANAVVTKDIPHNCVVGGIPAKVIKFLDDDSASIKDSNF